MTRALTFAVLAAALPLSVAAGVLGGTVPLPPADVVAALFGQGDPSTLAIVRELRLPRVVAAALVGGALAVSGTLLQGLLRNPLADPHVTGTSAGGALGAVLAVAVGGPSWTIPLASFAGALAAAVLVWRLARLGGRISVLTVLLAGIVLTAFAGAVVTLLLVASDRLALRIRAVLDVLVGGVTSRGVSELAAAAGAIVLGLAISFLVARRLDAYAFGEETAATLGIDTDRTTTQVLLGTSLLTGAAVALAGLVAFVGLVVPHALRPLVGATHRPLALASLLAGAAALVLADLGARVVLAPAELPVGVITGLVGGPFFLVVLGRTVRRIA